MSEASDWRAIYKFFHWGIALCIVLDVFWLEDDPHAWAGYLALAFVIARLILEFFLKSPRYANLTAKLVYFSIWALIAALAVSGWMLGLEEYWGDERLQSIHEILSNSLVAVIAIHFTGLILIALYHRKNTWKGMFP